MDINIWIIWNNWALKDLAAAFLATWLGDLWTELCQFIRVRYIVATLKNVNGKWEEGRQNKTGRLGFPAVYRVFCGTSSALLKSFIYPPMGQGARKPQEGGILPPLPPSGTNLNHLIEGHWVRRCANTRHCTADGHLPRHFRENSALFLHSIWLYSVWGLSNLEGDRWFNRAFFTQKYFSNWVHMKALHLLFHWRYGS